MLGLQLLDPPPGTAGLGTMGLCPCTGPGAVGPTGRGHTGTMPGYTSVLGYFPEADVAIVLWVDQSPLPSGLIRAGLADLVQRLAAG